jgi:hypothetical protein
MPMLLAACPSFERPWRDYVRDPTYHETLLYIHFSEFARHLIHLKKANETTEFGAVFAVVELLHTTGDPYVSEAATIGLLESLQNTAGDRGLDPELFYSHLQPESAKWWAKLNAYWNGDATALRK